jgi:DNA mismatch endonuclease (patch repair protein)
MGGNRKVDSRPEVALRSALHRRGHRFRKNALVQVGELRVRPDVIFPRPQVAVFLDGCFWHSCPDHGTSPRTNIPYWAEKLARNRQRDELTTSALKEAGWVVIRIWEHTPISEAVRAIEEKIGSKGVAKCK